MRKIIFLIHVSLDGYVAGPNGEMDWIIYNDELEKYGHALHQTTDAAVYGRITYQMMEGYWPSVQNDPASTEGERNHARWLDSATKIVVSKTLENPYWKNTIIIRDNIPEEFRKIKQQSGKDLWLIGSPSLAHILIQHNLIDEYWINVNPVVLGGGIPLFVTLEKPLTLKLLESNTFKGGVVSLRYQNTA